MSVCDPHRLKLSCLNLINSTTELLLISDNNKHFGIVLPVSEATVIQSAERLVCIVYSPNNPPFAVWTGPGELLKGAGQLQQPGADRGHGHRSHQTATPTDQGTPKPDQTNTRCM